MSRKSKPAQMSMKELWTPSNMLSFLRLLMSLPMGILLMEVRSNAHWILMVAFAAYITDLLDGWLARKLGDESKLGRILDPLADKVFIIVAVVVMAVQELLPLWFTIVIVLRDGIIFLGGMHLRIKTGILVQSTILGKAAVVSIGLVIIGALFSDGRQTGLMLLMLLSLGFITASLYMYGKRYFQLLKQSDRNK